MPAKLLVVNVTRGSTTKTVGAYPVAWTYTVSVTAQPHSDVITDPDRFYDGTDIKVGDYFTTTNGGKALQITSVISANSNIVTCVAEDVNQINGKLDTNQGYESEIPNGVGILFEVVNGLPVIYPLPDALPGTFDKTFSAQLNDRFQSFLPRALTLADIDVTVPGLVDGKIPPSQLPSGVVGESLIKIINNYLDLPIPGTAGVLYVVLGDNNFYSWVGTSYIKSSTNYNYINVETDTELENNQIANVTVDDLTITLPISPENGYRVIIMNNNNMTIKLIAPGKTINNAFNTYIIPPQIEITYLLYANGWKISDSNQLLNTSSDQFGPPEYWNSGVVYTTVEDTIYNKSAVIEQWKQGSELLGEQVTIFESNSDDFISIWKPSTGSVIQQSAHYSTGAIYPVITYSRNLLHTLSPANVMNFEWRDYETFASFISESSNFYNIINNQDILDIIASNAEFYTQYVNSNPSLKIQIPDMKSNTVTATDSTGYQCQNIRNVLDSNVWKAFDSSNTTYWQSSGANADVNQALAFAFPLATKFFPYAFTIYTDGVDPNSSPKNVIVKYKDNFGAVQIAGRFVLTSDGISDTFILLKAGIFSYYWEFEFVDNWGASSIKIHNIELLGWNMP